MIKVDARIEQLTVAKTITSDNDDNDDEDHKWDDVGVAKVIPVVADEYNSDSGRIETLEYENAELQQEKEIIERKQLDLIHQFQTVSKQQQQLEEDTSSLSTTRKSLVEIQQTKPRPKNLVKPKITSNGRRTPTIVVGVNGIKNNVDTSRKLLSSLSTTKRPTSMNELIGIIESIPISTIIEQAIVVSERVDSGNGGSNEDIHRFNRRNDEHLSSFLSTLVNSAYPKSLINNDEFDPRTALDYKSLLTIATHTSTSATTLLKRHQETLSLLDQPITKRQSLTITNHDSILPTSHVSILSAKTITFILTVNSIPIFEKAFVDIHGSMNPDLR
ncbi:unnamed protein product [Rotaria sordida]|uniref:Uncharacterized protein n=1 Tax=Rotaria sordida TaxID=392033 RepID=A0A814DGT9_9BILA|nr:unnamed protein product [Rotaria sordida]CAF1036404.1 unnamed protein product [Rotaria sordida]